MGGSTSVPGSLLVTGGRGRLASLIAGHFAATAGEPRLYSRTPGPGLLPLESLLKSGSLANGGTLLHLAWSTLPATSEQSRASEWQNDLPWLEKLLEALAAVPTQRRPHFVFFSSGGAVYGNAPGRPSREEDPCHPIGCYGKAKRAAEMMIDTVAARHGLTSTILRISNPYGYPVPANRAQGIIPHAIRCAREGQPLTLWGNGQARKDFLHYTDFLAALEQVIARRLTGTFNLCSGESHSVLEIIELVEKNTGKNIMLQHAPGPSWDVVDSRLTAAHLTASTGWRPMISLAEGIRRAAQA